jgi:hypothetical protein
MCFFWLLNEGGRGAGSMGSFKSRGDPSTFYTSNAAAEAQDQLPPPVPHPHIAYVKGIVVEHTRDESAF